MTVTRFRTAAVAVFAIVGLSACGSSTSGKGEALAGGTSGPSILQSAGPSGGSGGSATPSGAATESGGSTGSNGGRSPADAAFCQKIMESVAKLSGLSADASDPAKLGAALKQLGAFYADLQKSAPAELQRPIGNMVKAMDAAAKVLADPANAGSAATSQAMQELMKTLPQDAQQIAAYIGTSCSGS